MIVRMVSRMPMTAGLLYPDSATMSITSRFRTEDRGACRRCRGVSPLEYLYDYITAGDGTNAAISFMLNYNAGNLYETYEMMAPTPTSSAAWVTAARTFA